MRCRKCDYDLRGLSAPRCPECGTDFDPADPATFVTDERRALRRRAIVVAYLIPFLANGAFWSLLLCVVFSGPAATPGLADVVYVAVLVDLGPIAYCLAPAPSIPTALALDAAIVGAFILVASRPRLRRISIAWHVAVALAWCAAPWPLFLLAIT